MTVLLSDATDPARFGGKAANLAVARRSGQRVPWGRVLDATEVAHVLEDASALAVVAATFPRNGVFAVRSSAVDEDGAKASFAGLHVTKLNVTGTDALAKAIAEVGSSGRTEATRSYRERQGLSPAVEMAIIVQEMVEAEASGVLFTRDPETGEHVRIVEAAPGLGEAVVQGTCTPTSYRLAKDGTVLFQNLGEPPVWMLSQEELPYLSVYHKRTLCRIAELCEAAFPDAALLDIEWAIDLMGIAVLQVRPLRPRVAV